MANTDPLIAGVKQYLAELSDNEFDDLIAEVREPADHKPDDKSVQSGRDRYHAGRGA
ncbi:hypothetical protein MYK68_04090 [Gordonia sp. PP30]|uniref:hypothetical protein n=1 Tax=Gordonia sp. PP30 TaxID=2935861 RepID=UPI001FFE466E|nr:hypothetical protein [Gordonia sp. PP30]UQE75800.1 hypothetical protein MYK68_04090 [Gordonia sp. PP30]